jgi:hypothetical protein
VSALSIFSNKCGSVVMRCESARDDVTSRPMANAALRSNLAVECIKPVPVIALKTGQVILVASIKNTSYRSWLRHYATSRVIVDRGTMLQTVFTAPLHSNGNYLIVACVFVATGMCLPSRCLPMNAYSDFTIQASGRHVTVCIYQTARLDIPEYSNLNSHCSKYLRSQGQEVS